MPLDTLIPTNTGFKMMSEIKVGDIVFDKNGKETTVIHKSKIHYNPCYKIKFDNSTEIIADEDHRWEISFLKSSGKFVSHIFTTKELYEYCKNINTRTSTNIPKILNAKPINTTKKELPVDPYVLGVWLGDGSKHCGCVTQAKGSKVWDEIKNRGYELSPDHTRNDPRRDTIEYRTVYGLSPVLRHLGIIDNKGIPDEYMFASYEQRLDLVRGLMDTDGFYHKKRKRFVMGVGK